MRFLAVEATVELLRSDGVAKKLSLGERSSSIFVKISLSSSQKASVFCLPSCAAM